MRLLDPNATVWFSLASDAELPDDRRPAFETKVLSAREFPQLLEALAALDAARAAEGPEAPQRCIAMALTAVQPWLRGWRHLPAVCGAWGWEAQELLADGLTYWELLELPYALARAVTLRPDAEKKSGSPSPGHLPGTTAATSPV